MRFFARVRAGSARGLVVGLALGVVGTVASPAPAQADDTLVAAGELAGFIPEAVRYECWIDPNPGPASFGADRASVRVGLRCPGTDGVDFVEYYLFSDNAAMNGAYEAQEGTAASDPVRSTAGNCPSEGSWDFSGQTAGRVACYYTTSAYDTATGERLVVPETVVRVWTYDDEDILGLAAMPQGNTDAVTLRTWWNDSAGPLETADDVTGVVSSGSGRARFERALRAHIPAATRKTCSSIDPSDSQANAADYDDRLWIRAELRCEPTGGGADFVIYQSIAPAAVDGFFAPFVARAKEQGTPTGSSDCPDYGTWSQGKGAKKRVVGEFACVYQHTSDGVEDAELNWSHRKLGIVAYAVNLNDDPSAVIDWWNSAASGPQ